MKSFGFAGKSKTKRKYKKAMESKTSRLWLQTRMIKICKMKSDFSGGLKQWNQRVKRLKPTIMRSKSAILLFPRLNSIEKPTPAHSAVITNLK